MAGEAVTGRYSAARHAAADEGGARRHPDSDDRSLVDRLLAGAGDEQAFDWGWGDPSRRDAPDREPLHDIPELWDERSRADCGDPDGPEERFPTPRLHGESSRDDGADDDEPDRVGQDRIDQDRADDRGWSDRGSDDLGGDDLGSDDLGSDDLGSDDWGAPTPGFEARRTPDHRPGVGLFDEPGAGDRLFEDRLFEDRRFDDQPFSGRGLDGDPLDALSTGRVRAEPGPFGDGLGDRDTPEPDALDDVPMDGDHPGARPDPLERDRFDRSPLAPPLPNRGVLDGIGREPEDDLSDTRFDRDAEPPHRVLLGRDPLNPEPPEPDRPAVPADVDRVPSDERRRADDRLDLERDPLATERGERKLVDADPRLRRWADRDRPSGPQREGGDRPSAPAPFADEQAGSDLLGPDRLGADLFDPGERDRSDAPPPRAADPFGDDPAFTESTRTGRIHIAEAEAPAGDPAFDHGPQAGQDPRDAAPDPTTAFSAVAPAGPARRGAPEEPALPLEEYAARRRAAEQAAASAEEAAASAAERASAAIAAAARAAAEAEAAAVTAAEAAAKANEAAEAEVRAIADSVARGEAPGSPDGGTEAPEPPTQAVPLIAPSRAPGRRPPPRRPAGPPPRGARPDEPGRTGGPPPRGGPRNGPVRDGAAPDGADGEATAVLTGLDALRDPVRPQAPEPAQAPAEVTTVTRRRPIAEPAAATDDVDDADDAEHDAEPEENGLVDRLRSRPVIAAVGVGAVLVLAAIVAFFTTSEPEAAPAEPAPAALSAPVGPQPEPAASAIDPHSEKAVAFLTALRDADIPTSSSGQAETEAAAAICTQLDQGADDAQLARSVPAVLPDVTRSQASDVVKFAKKLYC
ncbi:DUF732 domain-containing protein [Pseudonocardia adelaidensis]|uniref:DUF732 domain-containing protein n=1 Tax=Pseudonocardia adelaidensis TaxID=648754 RepID=A0ABP9NI55_9PSEU